ncbi:MAG: Crp/Fnr family transcriptional regulator [Verrucomicrobia bacterium]|nr:Crp/Fnr family transcriptional regulator [Verrucomicrobiota bacterium]
MHANPNHSMSSGPNSFAEFRFLATVNTLRKCPLFADLSVETQREIAQISLVKMLAKGDYLFHEGAPVHGFYVVQSGAIKLHRVNLSGKEQVIHVFRTHEVLGEEALMSDSGHLADASAAEPSRVLTIRKAEFLALLKRRPELVFSVVKSVGDQFRLLLDLLEDLTLKDVPTRLANWLIQHCPNPDSHDPCTIELPMAKRLLASELGTVSETFSRTLARFRAEKLLTINGRVVTLLCPSKLLRLVRGGFGLDRSPGQPAPWKSAANSHHPSDLLSPARDRARVPARKVNGAVPEWAMAALPS